MSDEFLAARLEARRDELAPGPVVAATDPDRWRPRLDRLHLRLWWATRPRTRRLHCLVTAEDGFAVLGPAHPR